MGESSPGLISLDFRKGFEHFVVVPPGALIGAYEALTCGFVRYYGVSPWTRTGWTDIVDRGQESGW